MSARVFRAYFLSLAALALVVGAGCRESAGGGTKTSSGDVAEIAPAWRLKGLDGKDVTLSQFRGKVVLVDFWATWCAPCRAEMPAYVAIQKKYAEQGLVIVGISLDAQGPVVVKKFIDSLGITYPVVMGNDDVTEAYKVRVMPTTFLVDREGKIRHTKIGAITDQAEYEKIIESLL
ncbi:MAG TPA: TlpA disulfide reductase family protein [Opitutaceae bacterium]|nr:TlpA disulfide reductase family protein [Opitutaceae bacterium]